MATDIYILPEQGSTSRVGLEVYETDEDNFEAYTSTGVVTNNDSEESEEEDSSNFPLHQGDIKKKYYYNNLQSTEFEMDYKDMSTSGSFKTKSVNKNVFYKGVRLSLRKNWEEENTTLKWEDLNTVITGFITEQTFTETTTDVKISGMTKLLDQKFSFKFTQMKRSKILEEIIKTAGLTPVINVEGLDDDVTDFSNLSESSSSSDSELAGGQGEEIDSLVKKWVGTETNELAKAKKVHYGLRDYGIRYRKYYNSKYGTAENALKHARDPGINCGDCAILTTACMLSAGLNAYIVLRCDSEHYFTVIEINGTKYYSDLTWSEGNLSQREWNDTWEHNTCGSKYNDGKSIPTE